MYILHIYVKYTVLRKSVVFYTATVYNLYIDQKMIKENQLKAGF